jgi:hypothetical protein
MSSVRKPSRNHDSDGKAICDLSLLNLNLDPFPHVVHSNFITSTAYDEIRRSFPRCPPSSGPTGFSLYWGDEEYMRLLAEEPAWRMLFDAFHSQRFIDWARDQFAGIWEQRDCGIDLAEARYVPYHEDRIDKERATLRRVEYSPQELWIRMDIHQAQVGYDRPVHVDHARRLISMLIYFCDRDENEMTGGELLLHPGPHKEPDVRIAPRHNLMIAFPCIARSYHSVPEIKQTRVPRNYVQVHISSSVDLWPREATPFDWRRKLRSLRRRLAGQTFTRQRPLWQI